MKKRFKLDVLGQYYAGTINEQHSGAFSITVHLKEKLNHQVLKQALNTLVERFPFLSGHLQSNFFEYVYEISNDPLPLIPIENSDHTNHQIMRVLYGKFHFVVVVSHLLCDGRTLAKISRLLLIRYFEILGIYAGEIDTLEKSRCPEELEDAYLRFTNSKIKKTNRDQLGSDATGLAYHPPTSKKSLVQTLTYPLSASLVKASAKAHEITVSGFLLALIFKSIAVERAAFKCEEPIIASIPIDCRSFFPSKTMRNFVSSQNITMPEVADFTTMIKQLQIAFSKIDEHSVYEEISSYQKMFHTLGFYHEN